MIPRRTAIALLVAGLVACGGPATAPGTPLAPQGPDLDAEDVILEGDALVARVALEEVRDSPIVGALLAGIERQATGRVPELADALEVSGRAPVDDAVRLVATGRSLDEHGALFALAIEYGEEVDWLEDVVRAFNGGDLVQGTLVDRDDGTRVGVLTDDSCADWGVCNPAAVCAVQLAPSLVAWVAAPEVVDCHAWTGWVVARGEGDGGLIEMLGRTPEAGGAPPPIALYASGDRLEEICCAPFGLSKLAAGVEDLWLGVAPLAPAEVRAALVYEDEDRAARDRDALAGLVDGYLPTLRAWVPGLAAALEGLTIEVAGARLDLGLALDEKALVQIADFLSTLL